MAADIFAKIGTIKGESIDAKHKDEVEVLSWSWGVSQTGGTSPSGAASGKANFSDISFVHRIDKSSPLLMAACATGEHIKDATLTVRKAGKEQQEYLIFKMSDVLITSVQPSQNSGDSVVEGVTLRPAKVDFEYKAQKPDGSLDAGLHFKYDIKANKEG